MSNVHIIYKFNPEFEKKIVRIAQKLGVKPIDVLAAGVILLEQRLVERAALEMFLERARPGEQMVIMDLVEVIDGHRSKRIGASDRPGGLSGDAGVGDCTSRVG